MRAVVANGLSHQLDSLTDTIKWGIDRQDRMKREAKQDELRDLQVEGARLDLADKKKRQDDEAITAELMPWLALPEEERFKQPLPAGVAKAIEPYLKKEFKDADPVQLLAVGQSAKKVRGLLDRLPGLVAGLEQDLAGRRVVLPVFASNPSLANIKPDVEAALFSKDRFGGIHEEKGPDGKPTGRKYQVTGLGELMYDTGSKLLSAQLQAQVLNDKGQPTGETLLVPATKPGKDGTRSNTDDAEVSQSSLDQMREFLDNRINSTILLLKARDQAAQQALYKHSPEARKGLTTDLEADRKQSRDLKKIQGVVESNQFKQAMSGAYGPMLQAAVELVQTGLLDAKGFGAIITQAAVKESEQKVADSKDEREGATSVTGYASMGASAPRTAKLAEQYLPAIKAGTVSGKRVSAILDKVYAAEQKSMDRQATIQAQQARSGGGDEKQLQKDLAKATDDFYNTWDSQYALGNHAPAARLLAQAKAAESAGLGRIITPKNPNRAAVFLTNEMAVQLRQKYPNAKSWEEIVSWAAGDPQTSGLINGNSLTMWHEGHFAQLPARAETIEAAKQRGKTVNPYAQGVTIQ